MLEGEHLISVSVDPPALKELGVGEAYNAKNIVIYRESPVPLHHQIKAAILRQLESGILQPGDKLPAEKELAESLGISQAPVKQAILELAREGYVQRSKGKGTFVCSPKIEETINILTSFTESMQSKGIQPEMKVIDLASITPPPEVALQLRLSEHEPVIMLKRLFLLNGQPSTIITSFLSQSRFPSLLQVNFTGQSLYRVLERDYQVKLSRAENYLEVIPCTAADAVLLSIRVNSPTLIITGVSYDADQLPVEYARVLYRTDRFRFFIESYKAHENVVHLLTHMAP
jgi:GntR family transcriptional regulator, N-acetylglucosamine utilization regulator